jgi:hypothetical protein
MEWTTITIAIVAGIVAVVVLPTWAVQWGSVRRAQAEAGVKQDMLARGLSVEQILSHGPLTRMTALPAPARTPAWAGC